MRIEKSRELIRSRFSKPLIMFYLCAVSFLLTVQGCAGNGLSGRSSGSGISDEDLARTSSIRQKSLETMPSGSGLTWSNTLTGSRGSVTPVRTYKNDVTGQYCREYEEMIFSDTGQIRRFDVACRDETGRWQILKI